MTAPVDPTTAAEPTAIETEEVEVDVLANFRDLANDAIGEAPDLDAEDKVKARDEYRTLDSKGRSAARRYLEEESRDAVMGGQFEHAKALLLLRAYITEPVRAEKPAGKARTSKTDATVASIAAIQIAYSLAVLAAEADESLDPTWREKIAAIVTAEAQASAAEYAEYLTSGQEGDEPEIADVLKAAARISLGRSPKGQGRKPKAADEQVEASEPVTADAPVTAEDVVAFSEAMG